MLEERKESLSPDAAPVVSPVKNQLAFSQTLNPVLIDQLSQLSIDQVLQVSIDRLSPGLIFVWEFPVSIRRVRHQDRYRKIRHSEIDSQVFGTGPVLFSVLR